MTAHPVHRLRSPDCRADLIEGPDELTARRSRGDASGLEWPRAVRRDESGRRDRDDPEGRVDGAQNRTKGAPARRPVGTLERPRAGARHDSGAALRGAARGVEEAGQRPTLIG